LKSVVTQPETRNEAKPKSKIEKIRGASVPPAAEVVQYVKNPKILAGKGVTTPK
jgi:hypothetical protein